MVDVDLWILNPSDQAITSYMYATVDKTITFFLLLEPKYRLSSRDDEYARAILTAKPLRICRTKRGEALGSCHVRIVGTVTSSPPWTSARRGDARMVRLLLDREAHMESYYISIVDRPAYNGREEVAGILLDHGASPGNALIKAAHGGYTHLVVESIL
ncbi:hypothetical protein F5Y05DRAFT_415568 [Hypoxylon sp. FL0543]|nr:hypothetical protein F5Y05DRAFT_415568 [Hypoxylon sp. FL0543]